MTCYKTLPIRLNINAIKIAKLVSIITDIFLLNKL